MLFCNIITILWWHNHTGLMHKLQTFGIIKDFLDQQRLSRLYENFPDHPDTFQIIRKPSRLSGNFLDYLETFQILQRFSRLSGNFPDHPDNIQTILKLSSLFGNFPGYLETFEIIRRPFRLSGSFPDHPDTFQTIRKLSRPSGNFEAIRKLSLLSGNFTGYLEIFKIIPKHPRPSGHFLDNPETFQLIWKLSRPYGNFPVQFQWLRAKTFRTRKNFPDGNATMPRWFLCLCIKHTGTIIVWPGLKLHYLMCLSCLCFVCILDPSGCAQIHESVAHMWSGDSREEGVMCIRACRPRGGETLGPRGNRCW